MCYCVLVCITLCVTVSHCVCRHMYHVYVGWLSANLMLTPCDLVVSELGGDHMCSVCRTMLADSDMSPLYTLPLVLCALLCVNLAAISSQGGRMQAERREQQREG